MKIYFTAGAILAVGVMGYYIGEASIDGFNIVDTNMSIENDTTNKPISDHTFIGSAREVFQINLKTVDIYGKEVADVDADKVIYITNGSGKINKENLEPQNGSFILSEYEPYCETALGNLEDSEVQQYWKLIKHNPSTGYEEYIRQYSDTIDSKVFLGRSMLKYCQYSTDDDVLFTTKPVEVSIQSEGYLEYTLMIPEVKLLSGEGFLQTTINPEYKKEVTSEGDGI